jgi:tRNA A-37 threonylcarbamoyl transferase component Bud32
MIVDKYRIERLLATGGMGAVYLGTHVRLRKRVAIKVLNPQLSTAPMIERFHREAITASQIGHEGIAQVTDLGTSLDGEPFLVMEYLEGESLARRLAAGGRLEVADACELGCSILAPLAAAHRAGIIHRDLKPDNVFLVRQSRGEMVKLLDFGISRTAGLESTFRLTLTGLVLGTPYYMPPEQARGESEITPAADLYAFGVMLYEMLIGNVPIRAENYNALMYRVSIGDFARPRDVRPDLPRELERVILHAMAQSPGDRPDSAESLERELLPFCRPVFREHATGRTAPGIALRALLGERTSDTIDPVSFVGPTIADGDPPPLGGDTLQDPVLGGAAACDELDDRDTLEGRDAGDRRGAGGRDALEGREADRDAVDPPAAVDRLAAVDRGDDPAASSGVTAAEAAGEAPHPSGPPRGPRAARLLAGFAIVAGSAAAAGSLMIALTGPGSSPGSAAAVPAAAPGKLAGEPPVARPAPGAPASGGAPAPGTASAVRDATTITLRFVVDPPDAAITLDGTRLEATELAVARDAVPHRLQITAAGYASHEDRIAFDESQRLFVQLKRAGRAGSKGARIERTRIERTRPERTRLERRGQPERTDPAERTDPERTDPAERIDRADRIEKDSPYR